jgi:myo-inositol-1(or 4)-monophosphatase
MFCVSIGVLKAREPLVGVIHDPLRNQTFVAERGSGARLDGAPMRVSSVARLDHAVIGMDWARSDERRGRVLAYLRQVAPCCGTVRVLGSAALALAYVAAGWLDGYFHLALQPWDSAAGMLLIAEAGGRCTTLEGQPFHVASPRCLATNGLIHQAVLDVMGEAG